MLNNEASREALKKAKRIVIKVGTSTITYANGKRNFSQIDRLAREISDLQNQGKEMILVTSGAVAVGVDRMGLARKTQNYSRQAGRCCRRSGRSYAHLRKILCRLRSDCGAGADYQNRGD